MKEGIEVVFGEVLRYLIKEGYVTLENYFLDGTNIEPHAMERDEELIRAWLKKDLAKVKKAPRLGAEIVSYDEFGLSFSEPIAFTWVPRGQTQMLKRVGEFGRELSTMATLKISGMIYKKNFFGRSIPKRLSWVLSICEIILVDP